MALNNKKKRENSKIHKTDKVYQESKDGIGNYGVGNKLNNEKTYAKTKTRKLPKMHIARVMVFCRSDIAPRFRCFGRRGGDVSSLWFLLGWVPRGCVCRVLVLRPLVIALFVGGLFMPPWRHGHLLVTHNVVVSKIVTHNVCVFPYFTG